MMEEIESAHVNMNGQTPCFTVDTSGRVSHDSIDSGYLSTLTPHTSGYRTRSSSSGLAFRSAKKRKYCSGAAPRGEKLQRRRSKLHHPLSTSDYAISESSVFGEDHHHHESSSSSSLLEPSCTSHLVHSTPSCAHHEAILDGRNGRNWRTTVLITPATVTDFRLMSPSPAVPSSSYVATEPIQEEDVEMKLVRTPEKAQRAMTPPRLRIPRIVISPIRRGSPITITSVESKKLRELRITDLAVTSEIKPKKLDFSQRGLFAVLRNSDSSGSSGNETASTYAGRERVDFLSLLGEKSNHLNVVSKILSFLGNEELCMIAGVSNTWKRLCESDYTANRRRKRFLLRKQNIKENVKVTLNKSKAEEDIQTSPRSRHYARKGYLIDVKNLLNPHVQRKPPNSPPVSPSKVKFHSFVKASRTLASGEYLLPCPKCRFPCYVNNEKNMGTCSRQGCSIEFCICCSSRPHTGPCKTPLLATPTKRNNKRLIVGSRQSKRNLRRL